MVRANFFKWLAEQAQAYDRFQFERAFRAAGLSRGESSTLCALQFFANREGICAPSLETLAAQTKYSTRSLMFFLKGLCIRGWVAVRRAASIWHTNVYVLKIPPHQSEISNGSESKSAAIGGEATPDKQKQTTNQSAPAQFDESFGELLLKVNAQWRDKIKSKIPLLISVGKKNKKPLRTIHRAIGEAIDRIGIEDKLTSSRIMNIFYKYVLHARVEQYDNLPLNPIKNEKKTIEIARRAPLSQQENAAQLKVLLNKLKG